MKQRVCDAAAVDVLRETDNPAVMWGDEGLLHLIAERMGWEHECTRTSDRVLNALSKTPGRLMPGYTTTGNNRRVRIFHLPTMDQIFCVVGIIDAYGDIESITLYPGNPRISDPHETFFGLHGMRWRVYSADTDEIIWYKEPTQEESLRVKEHVRYIFTGR